MLKAAKELVHIQDNAKRALVNILKNTQSKYVKLDVDGKGCNGLTYVMKTTEQKEKGDELITMDESGRGLLIGKKAIYIVVGTVIDYETDEIGSRFVYKNPNVKNTCGCGESFNIK